jgi:hypothetical protein
VLAIGAGLVLGLAFFVAVIALVSWLGPSPFAADSVPERLPASVEVGILVGGAVLISIVIARFVPLTPVILERRGGPFALLTVSWSLSRGYWLALTALIASALLVVGALDLLAAPIGPAWRIVSALPSTMVSAAYGAVFYVRVLERDQQPIHEALPTLAT